MKILLDHNMPAQLRDLLPEHEVFSARALDWDTLKNGHLLLAAQEANFTVLLTGDQSIFYQQNNRLRQIALVVTSTNYRSALERNIENIQAALGRARTGSFEFVLIAGL